MINIIKALLFIIVLIFITESFNIIHKLYNSWSSELFTDPTSTPEHTTNPFTEFKKDKDCSKWRDDTTEYAAFKPLLYNPNTEYYYNREYAILEGIRRHNDVKVKLKLLKDEYDKAKDENIKKIINDELKTYKWDLENYALSPTMPNGEKRLDNDIITDYRPDEIGCNRPWIECHSHFPPYSLLYYKNIDNNIDNNINNNINNNNN